MEDGWMDWGWKGRMNGWGGGDGKGGGMMGDWWVNYGWLVEGLAGRI